MVDEHFVEFDSGEEVEMKVGEETPLVLASGMRRSCTKAAYRVLYAEGVSR